MSGTKNHKEPNSVSVQVDNCVRPILQPMNTAPKDGTLIIVVWYDEKMDYRKYNIREAKWVAKPRPHWEYINDNDFCMDIKQPNGWMSKPKLLKA